VGVFGDEGTAPGSVFTVEIVSSHGCLPHFLVVDEIGGRFALKTSVLVNEFYKKGCQEKSSPSTRGRLGSLASGHSRSESWVL